MPTFRTGPSTDADRTGYTLVEVLAVMTLLGFVATLVTLNLGALLPGRRLRGAAEQLAAAVAWARSESIGRGQQVALRYDLEAGTYWLALAGADGTVGADPEPRAARLMPRSLPESVRFAEVRLSDGRPVRRGVVTVRFSYLGACEGHTVRLAGPDGEAAVNVAPLGMQVDVYEG